MAKPSIVLPPNWRLTAVNWAARRAGMNYGEFSASVIQNDPEKAHAVEEEFKSYFFSMKQEEYERLAASRAQRKQGTKKSKGGEQDE